ncbi:hypothetical protein B0T16DRAFT_370772 [Cercophora newfieldiana]|uniref:NAD-dependent epimerase/dehydratase domain-containing protein n=1 Tax=Cercophora newfieldiana TaxID=92897 RepID=A0AA39YB72_9PEZI|nr:hypothetical protein B0T16DRAFT_370772 [Cercophora newfieldiana]
MSKGLVLVTGANGYIAAKTVEAFLEAGYSVRGTVRNLTSSVEVAAALPQFADKLSFVEVPDITTPGAFDDAVKGVDAVAHLAAPVSLFFTDPAPVLKGAVDGTLRALEAAATEPSIKSFVFMSSITAVINNIQTDYTYTESDWNEFALPLVEKLGTAAPSGAIYAASKTAAERAVWKFRDENKPSFTITAINPCLVAGPPLVVPKSQAHVGETYQLFSDVYTGKALEESGLVGVSDAYVDVRDVARLVVFGVDHREKANGERFIVASSWSPPQAVADILRRVYPERKEIIKEGTPGAGYLEGYKFTKKLVYDGSKAVKLTGQGWIPWEKTVVDTVEKLRPILD